MKKLLGVFAALLLCASSYAATTYVLTNDDNPSANSGTLYTFNTTTGALTQATVLKTGGTGLGGGFFAAYGSSVSKSATCAFIIDNGSNDVAAFQHTSSGITKIGNYSNSALNLNGYAGGSLALAPNGKTLYVSYSGSLNIGVWSVASNCALTLAQTFVPTAGADVFGALAVDPSGHALVVGSDSFLAADLATINQTTGKLTDAGSLNFSSVGNCPNVGCYPAGIDFTKDSKVVLFGNATISAASILSASLSTKGLSNGQYWDFSSNSAGVGNVNIPFLSAAGYAGNGALYLGASGYGPDGIASGEITAKFVESPLSITMVNSTFISNPDEYQFTIASTGNTMLAAEYPNLLESFSINSDGSLTALKTTTDKQASSSGSGLNFVFYPSTR